MSKILVVPDVHGRDFWKEPCNNWNGPIIFLGDYHDPYGEYIDGEPNKHDSLNNLRELSNFVVKKRTINFVICLLGNHDLSYFTGNLKNRYDYINALEVKKLLETLELRAAWELTTEPVKFLFSHAGITKDWLTYNDLDDISEIALSSDILEQVPYSRGGHYKYGSCIWNSLEDYQVENHLPEYYQIFGHTWGGRTEPVIEKDYAMLDCCKAFVLDTSSGKIVDYSYN